MADVTLAGTIDAVSDVSARSLFVPIKTPGSLLWDFSKLGQAADAFEDLVDGYNEQWERQSFPASDAPYELDTYSSTLCLALKQATVDGAYDWFKYSISKWAAVRTPVFRCRVLGWFTDSDLDKSMRIRLWPSAGGYMSYHLDGDRMQLDDEGGGVLAQQTGYNDGPFTAVLEFESNTCRARRINSHDPDLAFESWDITASKTMDVSTTDFGIAIGNENTLPAVHCYVKTLEVFFHWPALGGDIAAVSGMSGTLNAINLAGSISAVSNVIGTLTVPVTHELAGEISAVSGMTGTLNVPETPELIRGIRLTAPGGRHPIRRVPFGWIRREQTYVERIEAVAERALTNPILWAGSGWFRVSVDGGAYTPLGTTRATGVGLGAFIAGQRKTIDLELTVPAGAEIRTDLLGLNLGIGVDY